MFDFFLSVAILCIYYWICLRWHFTFFHWIHHHQTTIWEYFLGTFSKHQTCKFQNPTSTKDGKLYKDWKINKKSPNWKRKIIWTKPPWLWLLSTIGYAEKHHIRGKDARRVQPLQWRCLANLMRGVLVYNMRPWAPLTKKAKNENGLYRWINSNQLIYFYIIIYI